MRGARSVRSRRLALVAACVLAAALSGCATLRLPPPGTADRVERLVEEGRAAEAIAAARDVPRNSEDYARAQQLAARAVAIRVRIPREALVKGAELEGQGKWLDAVRTYERALVADPEHAGLETRLAAARGALAREKERRRFAAERAEDAGRYDTARAWASLLELDPEDGWVRRRVADLSSNRTSQAAIHLERARGLREDGRLREAIEEADLAARLDPSREAARELLSRLRAEESPSPPEGRPRTSPVAPLADGHPEKPADAASRQPKPARQEREPADPGAVREALAVARAATRRGDFVKAREAVARAESLSPRAPEVVAERAALERAVKAEVQERIKRGIARFQLEDLDGAILEWGEALELDPANEIALDYRRKAQGMLKKIDELREQSRTGETRSGVTR